MAKNISGNMSDLSSYQGIKPKYSPFIIPANPDLNILTFVINKAWFYSSPFLEEIGFKSEIYKIQSMLELTTFFFFQANKYIKEKSTSLSIPYIDHLKNNADPELLCEIECNFSSYFNFLLERETFYNKKTKELYNGDYFSFKELYALFFKWPLISTDDIFDKIESAELDSTFLYDADTHSEFYQSISGRSNQMLTNIYYFLNNEI